jgi:uncharacterized membrane protein
MLHDLLRGKLFGHPIHVMLVHFPAALLPVAAALDALHQFAHISMQLDITLFLWPGVVLGWLAGAFGIWDLVRLRTGSREMSVALVHGGINATALSGFTWALLLAMKGGSGDPQVWIEIVSSLVILVGNKFGGDLIFRLGVGQVDEQPNHSARQM